VMTRAAQSSSHTHGLKSTGHPSSRSIGLIENPVPFLQEAQSSAARIVSLQRELITLKAEHLAIKQAKRIGYGIAAVLSAFLAIFFSFGWLSYAVHQKGVGSIWIAVGMFVLFGGLSAAAVWAAWKNPL